MFKNVAALLLLSVAFSAKGDSLDESFKAPKLYPNITWAQLQKIHAEQISKMWIVRDGKEWIKVRDWEWVSGSGYVPCALPALKTIPKQYEAEFHRELGQGRFLARVAHMEGERKVSNMVILYPPKGMEGMFNVAETKTLWLGQRNGETLGSKYYSAFDIYPTEAAKAYREPTAREVALAMKNEGKTFMVKLPTLAEPCPRCDGRGRLEPQEDALSDWGTPSQEKQAENEGGFLSTDSGAYRRAKERAARAKEWAARANQPRNLCPTCGGKGKVYKEEFRTLIFRKP